MKSVHPSGKESIFVISEIYSEFDQMKMRKLPTIFTSVMLLVIAACQQVELLVEPGAVIGPDFTAHIETFDAETKTALVNGNSVVWSTDDQIAIFQGNASADKYQVNDDCVGTTSGTFSIVAKGETAAEETFNANIAIYPYQDGLAVTPTSATEYKITGLTIPSTQTYTANTFANGSFLMAAITDGLTDHTLNFKNLCGALKLQLKGTAKIKSIELKGNDGEPLSGAAAITIYNDGSSPTLEMSENASAMVSVNWIDGVQLNPDTATPFFITIPPTSFEKGFTVTVTDVRGCATKLQTSKPNSVARSYVHEMPTQTVDTDEYFTLDATSIHISFDDVIACLANLAIGTYSSLYDEPFFAWLKRLHDGYGAKFSLYVYDLSKLSEVPSTYKDELYEARQWLKFGLHSRTSGYNYSSCTYEDARTDWNTFVENVVRITGSTESVDRIPRLHNFAGNVDAVKGMRDAKCGALGFLGADDSRISYHLTDEQNQVLIGCSVFMDTENELILFRTNYRGERLGAAVGMYEKMEAFMNNATYDNCFIPFIWFTHEPYVYKNSSLTDYASNVEDVCRFAYDYGIPFVYPQNRIDIDATSQWYTYEAEYHGVLSPNGIYSKTPLYTLHSGQDGVIYDGLSFQGNGTGTITIRDLHAGNTLGTMKWDKANLLKPHDNSVSKNVSSGQDMSLAIPWKLQFTYSSSSGLLTSGSRAISPKLPLSEYADFCFTVTSCAFIVSCYDADDIYLGQISNELNGLLKGVGQWLPAGTPITKEFILSVAPETDHISLIAYNNEMPTYESKYSGTVLHIYSNVYNNYASQSDKHIGECCVYDVHGTADVWGNSLIQVLKVGFIDDLNYWPGASEPRPYGNFLVDHENGCLYVYVMYSSKKLTYWYKFDLPDVSDGVWDEAYGCYVKTLEISDVLDQWMTPLQNYIQGGCVHDGLIWSTEGFTATSGTNLARMRIIDPVKKSQIAVFNFYADGDPVEPEFIDFYDGKCYYGSVMQMYSIDLL